MAKFVNLTPHTINVWGENENSLTIPTSGVVARCRQSQEEVGEVNGFPVTKQVFGEVEGLPEEQKETYYIVSKLVAERVTNRKDILIPGPIIRDDQGNILGCDGFSII